MAGAERFPKGLRLRTRAEFLKVQERGAKVSADPLLALFLSNGLPVTRVGLTVSSKVGNAVVRSRIRRQLREVFRKRRGELPPGLDLVLIARSAAAQADAQVFQRAFTELASRLRRGKR